MSKLHWYMILGSAENDLDLVMQQISQILKVGFEKRYSSYVGDYYRTTLSLSKDAILSEIKIRGNDDPEFGGLEEPDFPQFPVLVYVSRVFEIESLESQLEEAGLKIISKRQI